MPAITRTARACALALAGLGLSTTTMAAPAAATTTPALQSGTSMLDITTARKAPAAARIHRRVLSAKDIAMHQRGDRYAYGASGPHAFDCSGLIYYSYRRAGFAVPRTSSAQAGATRRIAKSRMRAGDLMFFTGGGGVYHAGIFLGWKGGRAMMVHSPGSGRRVQVAPAWTSSWFGGTLRR